MDTAEVADKIRCIVFEEEKSAGGSTRLDAPIPWSGLSYHKQDHWKNIANAAGAVLGVHFKENPHG